MGLSAIVTPAGTPVMTRATAGSVTGTWGTGQNRTAGSLLAAIVTAGGTTASAAAISVPSGWTQLAVTGNIDASAAANAWAAVYIRTASGADAAPAFTATLAGTAAMTCTLLELVAGAARSPADVVAAYASGASAATLSAMALAAPAGQLTSLPGEYAVAVFCQEAAAAVTTWNAGSGWSGLASDGATSSVLHTAIDIKSNVASGAALAETGHWTADTSAFGAAVLVSFAPQAGGVEVFAPDASAVISAGGTTAPAAGTPELWTAASWSGFPVASSTSTPPAVFRVADPAVPSETVAVLNTATGLVIRGVDGTVPAAHAAGFTVQNVIGAGFLNSAPEMVNVPPATGNAAADSAAIRRGLAAAAQNDGGTVVLQPGFYTGDTGQFAVPAGVTLYFRQGAQLTVNCTGGSAVDAITVADAAALFGEGQGSSCIIAASSSFNARTLVSNASHAVQEWCYYTGLWFIAGSGAVFSAGVVEMVNCNANSGLRDCLIDGQGFNTGVPLLRLAGGASNAGTAPVFVEDSWIWNSGGDCVLITDGGFTGAVQAWLRNVTIEHPADGYHNVHLSGSGGGVTNVSIIGGHFENDNVTTSGPVAAVYVDGCRSTFLEDISLYSSTIANKIGVWITSNAHNGFVKVAGFSNSTTVNPAIRDDSTGSTYSYNPTPSSGPGFGWVHEYNGAGYAPVHYGAFVLGSDLVLSSQSVALASTAVDPRGGVVVDVAALAAAVTVAAPLHPQANQLLVYKFVQNGTGGFAVTWNAVFRVAAGVVSTTASKASSVAFRYDSSLTAWVQLWATAGV